MRRGDVVAGDARADGADHADAVTRPCGDGIEQVGGGGLPVGAGDAEHPQRRRRVAVQTGRDRTERGPDRRHPRLGDLEGEEPLDEQRHCTAGDGFGRVLVPVGRAARDAREARARRDLPAVVGDGIDLDVRIPGELGSGDTPRPVETGEQVVPTHACASSRLGHGIERDRVPGARRGSHHGRISHDRLTMWSGPARR